MSIGQREGRQERHRKHAGRGDNPGVAGSRTADARDVKLELLVVFDDRIAQADRHDAARLKDLLEQHRLEHWVEFLKHILAERRVAELQGVLERARKIGIGELKRHETRGLAHVLDPLVGLHLRIDHERPAARP